MENVIILIRYAVGEGTYSSKPVEDVEKILSKYKIVEMRKKQVRVIPADLPITLNDLIDYVYDDRHRGEELMAYDYETGEYYHFSEEGALPVTYSLTDGEKETVRKTLQETL